jgi:curved DNA-binding protein
MKDYYGILGVSRTASDDEIKRAYRRLASQHHPDKGGDKERFQEIQEAYAVLGDEHKRSEYDNPRQQVHINMGPGGFDFDQIFQMFGAQFRPQQQSVTRITLWIRLEDSARGGARPVSLQVGSSVSTVEISIPIGIDDGDTVRYAGVAPGGLDLVVTFRIAPDARWQRDGRNVTTDIELLAWDLLLGTQTSIQDLAGSTLLLTVPPRTNPGTMLRLKGRGLPPSSLPGRHGGAAGDLFVRVQARWPDDIAPQLLSAIRDHRQQ